MNWAFGTLRKVESPASSAEPGAGGKTKFEITGDYDLDRARSHVLQREIHERGGVPAPGILGGGNVSAGDKNIEFTGDVDLDHARLHVLEGRG
jgi:hypothetical protein